MAYTAIAHRPHWVCITAYQLIPQLLPSTPSRSLHAHLQKGHRAIAGYAHMMGMGSVLQLSRPDMNQLVSALRSQHARGQDFQPAEIDSDRSSRLPRARSRTLCHHSRSAHACP